MSQQHGNGAGPRVGRSGRALRIQLWSYNFDPEPTGIGPVSGAWARGMAELGHSVEVVAAHPHYPAPAWGRSVRPYREVREGVPTLRLPLMVGRASSRERLRQELSFTLAQTLAIPVLSTPDVLVAVSPSFPALAPVLLNCRIRRVPWVLWLQDILPDGAITTGLVKSRSVVRAARCLERAAYESADRIVVISDTFRTNLIRRGVQPDKVHRIFNPATLAEPALLRAPAEARPRLLTMGNLGHTQGLVELVKAFQSSEELARLGADFVLTGDGVAAGELRSAIATERVKMPGVVSPDELDRQLSQATLGVVSQRADIEEFNLPSKLMNFLARGVPVIAVVRPDSEVARIVENSGSGWVIDSRHPPAFPGAVLEALASPEELGRRGRSGAVYAEQHFSVGGTARVFEDILFSALDREGEVVIPTTGSLNSAVTPVGAADE